ncbi:MAG: MBL fold metallo-hydrolase [Acholeplasmatales bacterium]|nr:MBL fold metallo-hydrolase [Acholeplasmatales bacterium]
MKELKFLGVGSAFNLKDDNNSAYYITDDTFILLDCGDRIARKIINYNLLQDVKNVLILITHLHADHISSLETLIDYIYLLRKDINCKIIYPAKQDLETILNLEATYEFEILDDKNINEFNIRVEALDATHIPNSYSYLVYTKDFNFYYSGDTNKFNFKALDELKNNKIDMIYHEVSYPNIPVHTSLDDLCDAIPYEYRNKVTLMHFSDDKLKEASKEKGFNIALEEQFK